MGTRGTEAPLPIVAARKVAHCNLCVGLNVFYGFYDTGVRFRYREDLDGGGGLEKEDKESTE